jgi:NADPH:quinone reductase
MRAFATDRFGDLENLRLLELPKPETGRGKLLVRVHAAALNAADWKVLTGRDGGRFLHAARFPLVLGFDFSGVVEEVADDVRETRAGEAVFGFLPYSRGNVQGSLADYVVVPEKTVARKPPDISHTEAACAATAGSTALQGLYGKGRLRTGRRVLINGASGGVGSYAVQIARNEEAEVWATASASKAAAVRGWGAKQVVDYRKTDIANLGEKFDIVFDVASTSSFGRCARILEPRGVYVTLLPSFRFFAGATRALLTSKSCRILVVRSRREDLSRLADWMSAGRLVSSIDSTFPLEKVPEALRRLKSGDVLGKVAVAVSD